MAEGVAVYFILALKGDLIWHLDKQFPDENAQIKHSISLSFHRSVIVIYLIYGEKQ